LELLEFLFKLVLSEFLSTVLGLLFSKYLNLWLLTTGNLTKTDYNHVVVYKLYKVEARTV